MAISFFNYLGINLETSVPAMQMPLAETPAMQKREVQALAKELTANLKMAAGHMEVGELPGGSDSILQSLLKDVLEKMPRKELQALAKERGITANSKSAVIIETESWSSAQTYVNMTFFSNSRRVARCW